MANRCCLPLRSGFAELDLQIEKLRAMRDSYQAEISSQGLGSYQRYDTAGKLPEL